MSKKWLYLREKKQNCNPERHTPLNEYLEYIFPNATWIYDQRIPVEIQRQRNTPRTYAYRPDARCEELSLIVEFNGTQHYQGMTSILSDYQRTSELEDLGYKVINIPYWVQLSSINIFYYFGVQINNACELIESFYDIDDSPDEFYNHGINVCPGAMSYLGQQRFIKEFKSLPNESQVIIARDLLKCVKFYKDINLILPTEELQDLIFNILI